MTHIISISTGEEFAKEIERRMESEGVKNKSRWLEERLRDGLEMHQAKQKAKERQ